MQSVLNDIGKSLPNKTWLAGLEGRQSYRSIVFDMMNDFRKYLNWAQCALEIEASNQLDWWNLGKIEERLERAYKESKGISPRLNHFGILENL
jgi:hypothetical protein